MASSLSRQARRRRRIPGGWPTVGALVASATFGSRVVTAEPSRSQPVASPVLLRVEQSIGPWERPEDILARALQVLREARPEQGVQDPPLLQFDIPPGPLS